jgi:hypothetical protein
MADIPIPTNTKMIVFLGGDGQILNVTDKDGNDASNEEPFAGEAAIARLLRGYAVLAHNKSKQRCVTYQTPSGPRTV